jgi:hypothetical protein
MPQVPWTRYFLELQDYGKTDSIVYQDNQSTMLLQWQSNGPASSGKRTRHINIPYAFVIDNIASGKVTIDLSPEGNDPQLYFAKPLQGLQFGFIRDLIFGVELSHAPDAAAGRSVLNRRKRNQSRFSVQSDFS